LLAVKDIARGALAAWRPSSILDRCARRVLEARAIPPEIKERDDVAQECYRTVDP
jgi:hypothetical protein